jgi:cell division protein FtsB
MKAQRRARAALIVAAIFAVLTVATGFPLATLLRQRADVSGAVRELAHLRAHNFQLAREVQSLSTRRTITQIARQDYGLVYVGERAIVVLPGTHGPSSTNRLAPQKLPPSDFVPSAATTWEASAPATGAHGESFWGRVARHLEFWRGLF